MDFKKKTQRNIHTKNTIFSKCNKDEITFPKCHNSETYSSETLTLRYQKYLHFCSLDSPQPLLLKKIKDWLNHVLPVMYSWSCPAWISFTSIDSIRGNVEFKHNCIGRWFPPAVYALHRGMNISKENLLLVLKLTQNFHTKKCHEPRNSNGIQLISSGPLVLHQMTMFIYR